MFKLTCYDENGNTVLYLTQWDLNRVIYIENPEFSKAPLALFSNNGSNSYLVATELTENNEKIKITVPNLLLQQCKTISMGLCSFDIANNINNTKYILKLPVHRLAMPANYVFTDNTTDVNWLKNILGEYVDEGLTDMNKVLADINDTASTQIKTLENLAETSISKLGYYIGTSEINILSESKSIDVKNNNTFVLTDDGGMYAKNFYLYVYQYNATGNKINSTAATVGEEIDISAASYITLFGAGSNGTFTVTYRMSKTIDVVNAINDLISRVSVLEEKTSTL